MQSNECFLRSVPRIVNVTRNPERGAGDRLPMADECGVQCSSVAARNPH
jgi:hypothetical protein